MLFLEEAEKTLDHFRQAGLMAATAESCTGGLIAANLTAVAGSSSVVDCGFVTYSNEAKIAMLDVTPALIETHGAVSAEVASAMVAGALSNSNADVAVAVTGIAGPGGGSAEKPVGLVYIAAQRIGSATTVERCLFGDVGRAEIRNRTVLTALAMLCDQATA